MVSIFRVNIDYKISEQRLHKASIKRKGRYKRLDTMNYI